MSENIQNHFRNFYLLFSFVSAFWCVIIQGCQQTSAPETNNPSLSYTSEPIINANKKAVRIEDDQIREYISRMGLQMQETGTGLRYSIINKGTGEPATEGKKAKIEYVCSLLSGEICYTSEKNGTKEFKIGSGGVEAGLEEGILLMHKGGKAKFILPSHLAFGLLGDQNKIPGKSTLVYDVHLIDLN
jgi:FKBP-type peptidyl-prolyl cis-trans isomerase FkpA